MGVQKGFKAKNASGSSAIKHKSLSKSKTPKSIAQNTRSRHFPPAPAGGKIRYMKGWEEWENQLIDALHKDGKTYLQISQRLPGRTEPACRVQHRKFKARSQNTIAQQKHALPSAPPKRQYWFKKWEDWEDQLVVKQHNLGKGWEDISKMLPPRSADAVRKRWTLKLERQPQNIVAPPTRPVKIKPHWKPREVQLLKTLVGTGKSWTEVATQLPNRSADSCIRRWFRDLKKAKGKPTKKRAPYWEEWEERLLVSGHYAGLSWEEIAIPITGRSPEGCRHYWDLHFRSSDQDEPWTSEEVALLACLRRKGCNWGEISQELSGHTINACKMQWYKGTEEIQGPSRHRTRNAWSAEEVDTLVALHNTIGGRWEEICKHIPGRTENACSTWFNTRITKEDGAGGPPSEIWKKKFLGTLCCIPKNLVASILQADSLDEQGSGDSGSDDTEAVSNTHIGDELPTPRLTKIKPSSFDARKRKVIDIPMV